MQIDIKRVKIVTFAPEENIPAIREAVCNAGAGVIGNYDFCTSTQESVGTYIPNDNANPYIGTNNKLSIEKELRFEVICDISRVENVLFELRKVHPYEEPAIDIIPLLNESDFDKRQ